MSVVADTVASVLSACPAVLDAYLFGSTARGEERENSDVDVAVFLDPAAPEPMPFGFGAQLAPNLGRALGRDDVDVAILNRASPLLYSRVPRDGVRLVSRDPLATIERELVARSRWFDWCVHQRIWA